VYKAYQETLED